MHPWASRQGCVLTESGNSYHWLTSQILAAEASSGGARFARRAAMKLDVRGVSRHRRKTNVLRKALRLKVYGYKRKEHGMLTKGSKKNTIRFTIRPSGNPKSVQLAGDFNSWKPVLMRKGKNGAFGVEVPMSSDAHQYKFVIDGQWVPDPRRHRKRAEPVWDNQLRRPDRVASAGHEGPDGRPHSTTNCRWPFVCGGPHSYFIGHPGFHRWTEIRGSG